MSDSEVNRTVTQLEMTRLSRRSDVAVTDLRGLCQPESEVLVRRRRKLWLKIKNTDRVIVLVDKVCDYFH